ncbi:hypothetical protein R1080702_093 [Cyanophage S-RIM32]|uniref:Uncharacterized protein n=1 Tax=Cyanophage S-RIM32 TaxID=1278479 RepID=A0A127KLY0_9CAUD|nr:hypothetical protein BJD26_gp163 [Cyanophage S-RIM32]AMO43102.1 hypothetical protein R1080702_093 [Cyanophage S-RIM32]
MAQAPAKRRKDRDQDSKFFLYVAFHSVLTAVFGLFKDD